MVPEKFSRPLTTDSTDYRSDYPGCAYANATGAHDARSKTGARAARTYPIANFRRFEYCGSRLSEAGPQATSGCVARGCSAERGNLETSVS